MATSWYPSSVHSDDFSDIEKVGGTYASFNTIRTIPERFPTPTISGSRLSIVEGRHGSKPLNLDSPSQSSEGSQPSMINHEGTRISTVGPIVDFSRSRRSSESSADRYSLAQQVRRSNNTTPDHLARTPYYRRSNNVTLEAVAQAQQYRMSKSTSSDCLVSPMSSTRLPPFAPRQSHEGILHSSQLEVLTPRKRARRGTARSIDVLDVAKRAPSSHASRSASHMSTIKEKSQRPASTFAQRVFEAGKPGLMYKLRTSKRFKDRTTEVVDISTLGRMNQHVLQQKLVEQIKAVGDRQAWVEIGIKETLHDYCESVRDMELMEKCSQRQPSQDPFLLTTAKPLDCKLLEDAGLAFGNSRMQMAQTIPCRFKYTKRQPVTDTFCRFSMALLGGFAIIAPFLLMILIHGQLVRIIASCGFVVAAGLAITLFSEMRAERAAIVTATYAAALVLFVGTHPLPYQY